MDVDCLLILGYLSAILIGFCLGLIGGGGSILTVPALVYLIGFAPSVSVSYSLFIVGFSALVGSARLMVKGLVHYRAAIAFFLPSTVAVFFTRRLLVPHIPHEIFHLGQWVFTKDLFTMLLFAALMVFSAFSMIRQRSLDEHTDCSSFDYRFIFLEGLLVGLLTGLVGAGGGFLIIPALVIFAHLPMKKAVGTSLLIIAINSLLGFTGDVLGGMQVEWHFLLLFSGLSVAGILIGTLVSQSIPSGKLKPLFGWFVLTMGIYILARELFFHS